MKPKILSFPLLLLSLCVLCAGRASADVVGVFTAGGVVAPNFKGVAGQSSIGRSADGTQQRGLIFRVARAPVNTVPATQTVDEDTPLVFSALNTPPNGISVSDADNMPLSVTLTVTHGTLTLSRTDNLNFLLGADGTGALQISGAQADLNAALEGLRFDPVPNFNSANNPANAATLIITTNDGVLSDQDAISIVVTPVNDAPVADSQRLLASNTTPLQITLSGSDIDNDALTFVVGENLPDDSSEAGQGFGPVYGKLSGTAPNLIYTAPAGYRGRDVFTFYVSDGTTTSQQAKIEIQVDGARNVKAGDDSYNLILGPSDQVQQVGIVLLSSGVFRIEAPGVLRNDSFEAGSTLTVRATTNPQNGRFQLRNDGTLFYFPNAGLAGIDEFTYSLSDGKTTATARVRLNIIDRRAPELRFDTPTNGSVVKTLNKIAGRARDRQSGLKSLTLLWQRFDGKFWNGSAWVASATELPLEVDGINWVYESKLPEPGDNPETDLLDGNYDLRVTAVDKSNNITRLTNRITIRNTAPQTPDFSAVRLSSVVASAAQGIIVLRFTGALNAESAGNIANYAVMLGDGSVKVVDAVYSENTVTLSGFDLKASDELTLQISGLKDTDGKPLRDGTINLIAR